MAGPDKHEIYDTMTTEALRELLRRDFLKDGDDRLDDDTLLYISQRLAEREDEAPLLGDAEQSWQSFRRHFIAPDNLRPSRRALRMALIAAAVAVILIGAAYAADALGWLPKWTDDHFTFAATEPAAEPDPVTGSSCSSLEEALALHDAPDNIVPSYFPAGYEPIEFNYASTPNNYTTFGCLYSDGMDFIVLSYSIADNSDGFSLYTKDEGEPEIYTVRGIEHYVMTNAGKYKAVWQNGNFECSLSGFERRAELTKSLDSMY